MQFAVQSVGVDFLAIVVERDKKIPTKCLDLGCGVGDAPCKKKWL